MKVSWGSTIQASGDIKFENGRLAALMPMITRSFTVVGTLSINANYALAGETVKTLFDTGRLEGAFVVEGGELNNVDIVRALQSSRNQRGGKTRFEKLTGTVQVSGPRVSYRQLQLSSGPMNASGTVDVSSGALSGSVNAELSTSKGTLIKRETLGVAGTLADPQLR